MIKRMPVHAHKIYNQNKRQCIVWLRKLRRVNTFTGRTKNAFLTCA